jgi:hypothetical protein
MPAQAEAACGGGEGRLGTAREARTREEAREWEMGGARVGNGRRASGKWPWNATLRARFRMRFRTRERTRTREVSGAEGKHPSNRHAG